MAAAGIVLNMLIVQPLKKSYRALALPYLFADEAKTIEWPETSDMHLRLHYLMWVCDAGSNGLH